MNAMDGIIDQQLLKANNLTDFCNIACSESMKAELFRQQELIQEIQSKLVRCKRVLALNPDRMQRAKEVLRELRRQEVIMKLVLEKNSAGSVQKPAAINNSVRMSGTPDLSFLSTALSLCFQMVTPTRPIATTAPRSSVKKLQWDRRTNAIQPPPPSTGKKKANVACMDDFVYVISETEFNTIPKYIRGREHLNDLQRCIDEIICPCLVEKYSLMNKPTKDLTSVHQRQLKRLFQDQESHFPGHYFVTEGDIARFLAATIDKRLRTRLQMLRQLGLVKEQRKNSTAFFLWMVRIEN